MADQIERVILEAEDRTKPATTSANANIASVEKRAADAGTAATKAGQSAAQAVVVVTDRTQKQIDRVVSQAESRLLSLKSPIEKLESMKSSALSKVAGDPAAIGRVSAAYDRLLAIEKTHNSQLATGAQKIKQFIQDPSGAATGALEGLGTEFGAVGLAAGATAGVLIAVGAAAFNIVESSGKAAEQLQNLGDRLGVSTKDAQLLADTARIAGVDVDAFGSVNKKLSETLASGGAASDAAVRRLDELGVAVVDQNGKFRGSVDILRDLSDSLNKLPDNASQVKVLSDVLGKGATALLPEIKNFRELEAQARPIGPALEDGVIKNLGRADDALDRLGIRWDRLKAKLADKIVGVIDFFGGGEDPRNTPAPDKPVLSAAQQADISRGNSLVDRFRTRVDQSSLQRELSQLETSRNEIAARIQKGAGAQVQQAAIAAFDSISARIEKTKTQIKDFEEVPNKEKEAHKALLSAQAEEADGLAKLEVQRRNQLELLGVTKKAIADINSEIAVRIKLEERTAQLAHENADAQNQLLRLQGSQNLAVLGLEPSTKSEVDARGAIEGRRADLIASFEAKTLALKEGNITRAANFEIDKLEVVLKAGLINGATYTAQRAEIERKAQDQLAAARIESENTTNAAVVGARVKATAEVLTLWRSNARTMKLAGRTLSNRSARNATPGCALCRASRPSPSISRSPSKIRRQPLRPNSNGAPARSAKPSRTPGPPSNSPSFRRCSMRS